jgi:hypothetical protein
MWQKQALLTVHALIITYICGKNKRYFAILKMIYFRFNDDIVKE